MNINELLKQPRRRGEIVFDLLERSKDVVISIMPITDGIRNPYGLVQAGAMIWIADVTASVLIVENTEMQDNGDGFPLAVNLSSSILANQKEGEIRAEARFVKKGRRVSVVRTKIIGDGNKLLAEITSTHVPATTSSK